MEREEKKWHYEPNIEMKAGGEFHNMKMVAPKVNNLERHEQEMQSKIGIEAGGECSYMMVDESELGQLERPGYWADPFHMQEQHRSHIDVETGNMRAVSAALGLLGILGSLFLSLAHLSP